MKDRPILFSGEMVRAILEDRKTQTRRTFNETALARGPLVEFCPYGKAGDVLWVRETWIPDPPIDGWPGDVEWNGCGRPISGVPPHYRKPVHCIFREGWSGGDLRWRPGIHMPRWASRIALEITNVRTERVRSIGHRDIAAEGVGFHNPEDPDPYTYGQHKKEFELLWDKINAHRLGCSWQANPWVWVIEFKRHA